MAKVTDKRIEKKEAKPSQANVEYKSFPFEVKDFREDGEYFYFEGYLSTFGNEDRGGDVVNKGAFKDSLKEHKPSLFWAHKSHEPLGVFDSLTEDEEGLYVKARMPLEDTFVKNRIIPQMRIGSIKSMSIGYAVWGEKGAEYAGDIRHLNKLFLWEGSLVTIPMNDQASLKTKAAMGFKGDIPMAERPTPWDEVIAIGRIRDWAGAEDDGIQDPEIQQKYQQAFLWYDHEDPDLFGSYKLPIADIIEGKLTIIPRAVFAAAARLRGARGGVYFYFPDDRPKVMRTVEKYYEKLGLSSPFGKTFRIDDFKALDARTLEKLLQGGSCMTKESAKMLVSFIKAGYKREEESVKEQCDIDLKMDGINDNLNGILSTLKGIKTSQ